MVKYEFKKITIDEFELHYTKKDGTKVVIPFKRTIELAKRLQSLDAEARFNMLSYLKSIGKTKNDLIVEKTNPDGTITVDESSYKEFEAKFMEEEGFRLANEIFELVLGKKMLDLLADMGFEDDGSSFVFATKFRMILSGQFQEQNDFPGGIETEQVSTSDSKEQ